MTTFVLTVVGADRPGLVSALSSVVAEHGGNWLTSRMAQLSGQFAGVVLVEVTPERTAALRAGLADLAASGLRVEVTEAGPAEAAPSSAAATDAGVAPDGDSRTLDVTLLGDDRPGIVRQITGALAAYGVSIEELETGTRAAPMAGGQLFEARARLRVPAGTDLEALRAALEHIADELLVELELNDA